PARADTHSAPIPAALTTPSATLRSATISAAKASGVEVAPTSERSLSCFCAKSGSATIAATSLANRSTIGRGVPAGANRPYQPRDGGAVIAGLLQGRGLREIGRADVVEHHQRRHGAGPDLADHIALPDQPDRR